MSPVSTRDAHDPAATGPLHLTATVLTSRRVGAYTHLTLVARGVAAHEAWAALPAMSCQPSQSMLSAT